MNMVEWPWEILNNISNFWIFKAVSGQNLEFSIFQLCDLAMLNFIKMLLLTIVNARRDIFEWLIKNGNFVSDTIELRRNKDYRGVFPKKFIAKDEIIMKIVPENLIIYNDEWRDWERFNKKNQTLFSKNEKKKFCFTSQKEWKNLCHRLDVLFHIWNINGSSFDCWISKVCFTLTLSAWLLRGLTVLKSIL